MTLTLIKTCGIVSLLCGLWNLYGDVYYLDFYIAHMSTDDGFAMVGSTLQPGNIFNFEDSDGEKSSFNSFWLYLAQAGGWMYPIWAATTALPLYIGLKESCFSSHWKSTFPCILLAYGICIMGGSLHSAFAFLTALPRVYHHNDINDWNNLKESEAFGMFLTDAQSSLVEHLGVGCFVGYMSINVASVWIAYIIATQLTKFPRWVNLFNPFVTISLMSVACNILLSDPLGLKFYVMGSMGSWAMMALNLGTVIALRYDQTAVQLQFVCVNSDCFEMIQE